jgi:hypothetical protein
VTLLAAIEQAFSNLVQRGQNATHVVVQFAAGHFHALREAAKAEESELSLKVRAFFGDTVDQAIDKDASVAVQAPLEVHAALNAAVDAAKAQAGSAQESAAPAATDTAAPAPATASEAAPAAAEPAAAPADQGSTTEVPPA